MRAASTVLFLSLVTCGQREQAAAPSSETSMRPSQRPTNASDSLASTGTVDLKNPYAVQPMRVDGHEVKPPVSTKRSEIDFGPCLKSKVEIGLPILEAVIDERGVPQNVRFLKPQHPCVEKQVIEAVKKWRFRPGTYRGKAVPVIYNMTVHIHYR